MHPLGTWFVSGICVWIPCIKETMMMKIIIIIIIITTTTIIIIIIIIISQTPGIFQQVTTSTSRWATTCVEAQD